MFNKDLNLRTFIDFLLSQNAGAMEKANEGVMSPQFEDRLLTGLHVPKQRFF